MQTVYSGYYPTNSGRRTNVLFKRAREKDYLIRSEKRTPYDTGSFERPKQSDDGKKKSPRRGVLYMALTILILVIMYPVGLFLLWSRKLKWRLATKMLMTTITACAFCLLAVFVINVNTGNPKIEAIQKDVRAALTRVNDHTGDWVDGALLWCADRYNDGIQNAALIWDASKAHIADEALGLYARVSDNLQAVTSDMPTMLLAEYKTRIGYVEPEPVSISLSASNTPPPEVKNANLSAKDAPATSTPSEAVTRTNNLLSALDLPIATVSEPTKLEKITLPTIKDASYAPVYFTQNGVRYHMTQNCSGMMNAVSHTLNEANEANKAPCEACGTPLFSMIDCDELLWVDTQNMAHTSDECLEFASSYYRLMLFDEIQNGIYSFCKACGGDICESYINQNIVKYITDAAQIDENTHKLYNYEKSITVYYMPNYRYYHADMNCDGFMTGDFVNSLYAALHVDGLSPCAKCTPLTEEAIMEQNLHLAEPT